MLPNTKNVITVPCSEKTWRDVLSEPQILERVKQVTGAPSIPALHSNATVLAWNGYSMVFHWDEIGKEVADLHIAIPKSSLKACRVLPMLAAAHVFRVLPSVDVLIIEPMRGKMTNLAVKLGWKKVPSPRLNMYYLTRSDFGELI